jgi:hypothetical protein
MSDSFFTHIQELWNHLLKFMEFFIVDQDSLYPDDEQSNIDADFLDIYRFYEETETVMFDSSCNTMEDYFEDVVSVDENLEKDKDL